MALTWDDKITLMAMGGNPGGIPNAPYDPPKEDPKNPWVPAPKRDKLAGGKELRDHLKPHTRGKNQWDTGGGSLQHLSPDKILELTRGGLERFKV